MDGNDGSPPCCIAPDRNEPTPGLTATLPGWLAAGPPALPLDLRSGQPSPTVCTTDVSQEQVSRHPLFHTSPPSSKLSPDPPLASNFDALSEPSASRQPRASISTSARISPSTAVPAGQTPCKFGTSTPFLRGERPVGSQQLPGSESDSSLGCSSALLEREDPELELERTRLRILHRRKTEMVYNPHPNVQGTFAPIDTTLRMQGQGLVWSSHRAGVVSDPLRRLPPDLRDRSLSEIWTRGFQIGMESSV